jgi:hypothetical protein
LLAAQNIRGRSIFPSEDFRNDPINCHFRSPIQKKC